MTDGYQKELPTDQVGQFLSMVQFENRQKLEELSIEPPILE